MTPDWNWFFSTLSQSTAAIVGIIGAFIIAKISANQSSFNEKSNRIKTLATESHRILDKISTLNFEWYNQKTNSSAYSTAAAEISAMDYEHESAVTDEMLLKIYHDAEFSIFSEREPILEKLREEVASICKQNLDRRIQQEAAERAKAEYESGELTGLPKIGAMLKALQPTFHMDQPRTVLDVAGLNTPWALIRKEKDLIVANHLEAKHHARVVKDFLESIKGNPESPPQITFSLMFVGFIFLAGVIYPLTFMPAISPPQFAFAWPEVKSALCSPKGALLVTLALSFSAVFYMFIKTNISMKYKEDDVAKLDTLSSVNNYSKYFKYLD